ncbi:MAG TPA: DUF945 family protein [Steroidobacteraceae bacterium]|nr:DUF945 family protein [Steroidobacteraceae bacterium]
MKKIVVLVIALLLLLVVAPWGIGRLAEKRVNAGLDRLVQEAPYMSIVERKWTSGWFRSQQEVTFELLGPWLKAMNPATVLTEIEKAEEAAAAERNAEFADADTAAAQALEQVEAAEDAAPGSAETASAEAPEAEAPEASEAVLPPIRFTVRNEILHGPLLWPASLGLARVNTKVVLSDDFRRKLLEIFGTDEPLRISSRVGFFGGGSTRLSGDGQTIKLPEEAGTVTYDDYQLDVGYSKNLDDFDVNGEWPRIEANKAGSSERLLVSDISLVGESERVQGELYDADYKFAIDRILAVGADGAETTIDGIHYLIASSVDDGFMDVGAKVGTGKLKHPALAELQFDIDQVHYDFTLRRLHAETLDNMMTAIKAAYSKPVKTVADVENVLFAPMKEHAVALLKHDPELVFDRIGIVTPEGEGVIKGVLRLKGMGEADFATGSMAWLNKLEADFTIECAQKLIEKIPNGATGAGVMVDQGFAKREGDKLVSRIEYEKGELKINGKAQPIPGLGGPPPERMEPEPTVPE